VEYGGGRFAILFIAEYGNIIFISILSSLIFFGGVGVLCYKILLIVIRIL